MDLEFVFCATTYFVGAREYDVSNAVPRLHSADKKIDEAMQADLVFHMGDRKPDVKSKVVADLAKPKLLGVIPQSLHLQIAKIELENATITITGYISRPFILLTYGRRNE